VQVWQEAIEQAGGKLWQTAVSKALWEHLEEQNTTPSPLSHKVEYEIQGPGNPDLRKHVTGDGRSH